jgi:hypothetical protein
MVDEVDGMVRLSLCKVWGSEAKYIYNMMRMYIIGNYHGYLDCKINDTYISDIKNVTAPCDADDDCKSKKNEEYYCLFWQLYIT